MSHIHFGITFVLQLYLIQDYFVIFLKPTLDFKQIQ